MFAPEAAAGEGAEQNGSRVLAKSTSVATQGSAFTRTLQVSIHMPTVAAKHVPTMRCVVVVILSLHLYSPLHTHGTLLFSGSCVPLAVGVCGCGRLHILHCLVAWAVT